MLSGLRTRACKWLFNCEFYPRSWMRRRFGRHLQKDGPPSTLVRFLTSSHVKDLQVITQCTIILWLLGIAIVIVYGNTLEAQHYHAFSQVWHHPLLIVKKILSQHAMLGALTAAAGVVLSWVYQTGSKRLGVVDLFACEIGAICRTCFIVDLARHTVAMADQPPPKEPLNFAGKEEYTPVCDTVLADLQPLDIQVVESVTKFYNYRKAMMDYMRSAFIEIKSAKKYRELMIMMLYMQFLMYESARESIHELVEFEPNRDESLINILCSEISVYKNLQNSKEFLTSINTLDYRGDRLALRAPTYAIEVPKVYSNTRKFKQHRNWQRAYTTAPELKARYEAAFYGPFRREFWTFQSSRAESGHSPA